MSKKYYLMVNHYRTSTGYGFANTWGARAYASRAERDAALRDGLPVNDQWHVDNEGRRTRCRSSIGLRLPTPQERRQLNDDQAKHPGLYDIVD